MIKNKKINAKGFDVVLNQNKKEDFSYLTNIAKYKDKKITDWIIQNWLKNRNAIELLGFWETLNNPNFKSIEFDGSRK